jgi:hypothetical protein
MDTLSLGVRRTFTGPSITSEVESEDQDFAQIKFLSHVISNLCWHISTAISTGKRLERVEGIQIPVEQSVYAPRETGSANLDVT